MVYNNGLAAVEGPDLNTKNYSSGLTFIFIPLDILYFVGFWTLA